MTQGHGILSVIKGAANDSNPMTVYVDTRTANALNKIPIQFWEHDIDKDDVDTLQWLEDRFSERVEAMEHFKFTNKSKEVY